jgi:hypothetical protein
VKCEMQIVIDGNVVAFVDIAGVNLSKSFARQATLGELLDDLSEPDLERIRLAESSGE